MERKCLDCGATIRGRADKKFCSDQCRNNYNNKRNRDKNNLIRNVNNTLRKNRRILERLTPNGKTKVHRSQLDREGFNFKYHTHTYKTKKGKVYYFCYEHGFLPLGNNFFLLVRREKEQ